jgi:LIVCS family branched-chain amino acid:cation transporter
MSSQRLSFILTGFAIFAMFFGAGNVVFPLAIGQFAGTDVDFAVLGLLLTGILLPLSGLVAMILFNSDYYEFFYRLGKWPGLFLILMILALIGPFAGIPRTITLSYSTLSLTWVKLPEWQFYTAFCVVTLLLAYRRDAILTILGKFLTPILLFCLAAVITKGVFTAPVAAIDPNTTHIQMFVSGFITGYNTMDLLAALFFSTVVLAGLHAKLSDDQGKVEHNQILKYLLKACAVAGLLLLVVYGGFCLIAAKHAFSLQGIPADELLGALSLNMLGDYAGPLANGVVSIACLTTAVTLTSVFAEFLSHHFYGDADKMYKPFVIVTVLTAFAMSFLGFVRIIELIFPIIAACYPMLVVLAFCNIAYKLWGFQWVKLPVLVSFLATVLIQYL